MPTQPTTPPLTLEIETTADTAIVRCQGRLVTSSTDALYLPVAQLIPTHKRIVLDLTGLTQMDSMGLGTLVRLAVSARSKGCRLELLNLGKKVRDLLVMTNLLSVFTIVGEHGIKLH
jgi:anti-anti-sigma factor